MRGWRRAFTVIDQLEMIRDRNGASRKQIPPRCAVRNDRVLLIRSLAGRKDNKVDRARPPIRTEARKSERSAGLRISNT